MKRESGGTNIACDNMQYRDILVVEDDNALMKLVQKRLKSIGISTKCISEGLEAINWLINNPTTLLLLDYKLLDITGEQFINTLNEQDCRVPFIVMTGNGDEKIAVEMMKLGARDYVVKDAAFLDVLPQVVQSVLEQLDIENKLFLAEKALKESERRYRLLFESVSDGIVAVDKYGNITDINVRIEEIFGYTRNELIGKRIDEIPALNYKDKHNVLFKFKEVIEGKIEPDVIEMEVICKDGSKAYVDVSTKLIMKDNSIEGSVAVIRNITEQKMIEIERRELERKAELTSRLATVGTMASGIAHEINNPLTGVIGFTQLLMQKEIPEDIKRDMQIINDGAQRVANIVTRLLTFARQSKPEWVSINLHELIENTIVLRAYEMEINNININSEFCPDLVEVKGDIGQIQQVILNIIINAEKEMKLANGKGNLLIKTEVKNNIVRILFIDDGPGISAKNLDKVFDPFFTTREVGEGVGLGLSICHGIITDHKGRITVESQFGKGATFVVELPVATDFEQPEKSEITTYETKKGTGQEILIIDDEIIVRQFLNQVLLNSGFEVHMISNGKDALEKIRNENYSLIISDIKMPGINGIDFYMQIKNIDKSLTNRIIFITGDVMNGDTWNFIRKTKAPYLCKPFTEDQLKVVLEPILAKRI